MTTQPLVAKLRIVAAATILACAANQTPARAIGFEGDPSITDMAQLATAVLSLPAALAAQANPDSKTLACLEHALNLTNEVLAFSNQDMYFELPWIAYDGLQTGKILSEALEKHVTRKVPVPDASNPLNAVETLQTNNNAHNNLDENEQTKQQMKRLASIALVICRTALRTGLALNNGTSHGLRAEYHFSSRAYLCLLSSLTRLANAYLHTNEDDKKAILIGLMLSNMIALGIVHVTYHGDRAAYQQVCELLRPAQEKTAAEQALNRQDVANVFEACGLENREEFNRIYEDFPRFLNIFCRARGIAPVFRQISRAAAFEEQAAAHAETRAFTAFFNQHPERLDSPLGQYYDSILLTNQEMRTFCDDFYTFCQQHNLRQQGSNASAFTDLAQMDNQHHEPDDDLGLRLPRHIRRPLG
jgi:hypothetical protein